MEVNGKWEGKDGKVMYSCSQTHTSSTFAAKCSFLNSSIQHMLWDLLTVTLKSLLTCFSVSALYELQMKLSQFLQVRVIASNPRTPQVKAGIALTEFADAEEELKWLTDCKKMELWIGASEINVTAFIWNGLTSVLALRESLICGYSLVLACPPKRTSMHFSVIDRFFREGSRLWQ